MKTVCLVEVSNGGHREAFMQLFVKALAETGNAVICVMPDFSEVKSWVENNYPEFKSKIHYFSIHYPHDNTTKFSRLGVLKRAVAVWKFYKKEIQNIEKLSDSKIDLVFWNCLDGYVFNYFPSFISDLIFPYKWSGLYFHPNHLRINPELLNKSTRKFDIDNCLQADHCVAVTVHDEGVLTGFQNRIHKKVILFPEIADATAPVKTHALATLIKEKAKDRIIVGIIGLEPYKGALTLMRLVKIADPSKFFFAFTGYFLDSFLKNLTAEEKNEYLFFQNNLPENCIWATGGFKEGADYNSVFCSFDIINIVYKNFYSSSNRLTKAAIFHKLVLGNNYGCVGDDIPKYNLGETADENNIEEQYQKLEILRNQILAKDFPYEQWKIYAEKHSTERLKEKFEELLNLI